MGGRLSVRRSNLENWVIGLLRHGLEAVSGRSSFRVGRREEADGRTVKRPKEQPRKLGCRVFKACFRNCFWLDARRKRTVERPKQQIGVSRVAGVSADLNGNQRWRNSRCSDSSKQVTGGKRMFYTKVRRSEFSYRELQKKN